MKEGITRIATEEELETHAKIRDYLRMRLPGNGFILLYESRPGTEEVGVICTGNVDMIRTLEAVLGRMKGHSQNELFEKLPRQDSAN